MSYTVQNFYKSTLSQDWSIGTGNFYVVTKPTVSTGWLVINPNNTSTREIIKYTATGTDSNGPYVTVSVRGVGGTTEQIHTQGEPIRMNITAEYWDAMNDDIAAIVASGVSNANTTTMGGVEIATDAEVLAGTNIGGTGASLVPTPGQLGLGSLKGITGLTKTTTTSATPSINIDTYKRHVITAQEVDITSMSSGLSGTPVDGQELQIRITPVAKNPAFSFVATSSTNDSSSTITVTKPSGTTDNDIMFALISCQASTPTTVPSGWTLLGTRQVGSGYWANLYYKVASSEGASYVWGVSGSTGWDGTINTFRGGFNITNPVSLETFVNTGYVTSNDTVRAATTNVLKQNSPLIFFGHTDSGKTFTPPTGFTEVSDYSSTQQESMAYKVWTSYGATGNIDATISASATSKHAMLVALNPALNITWGSSFAQVGDPLPTALFAPNDVYIDFIYNSTTAKWETTGQNNNEKQRKHYCGVFTKDLGDASGSLNVAHGLMGTPSKIRFTAVFNSATVTNRCDGVYTPDIQYELHTGSEDGSGNTRVESNANIAFFISNAADFGAYQSAVVSAINNNYFTLTFTKSSTPAGTAYIFWEASI